MTDCFDSDKGDGFKIFVVNRINLIDLGFCTGIQAEASVNPCVCMVTVLPFFLRWCDCLILCL